MTRDKQETQTYVALIGDVINSKDILNRQLFQEDLQNTFDQLNQRFQKSIVSNLTITLGDEFQVLCRDVETVFLIIDLLSLKYLKEGIKLRFGMGIGTILTDINAKMSIGADGPAYWSARKAIETVYNDHDNGNTSTRLEYHGEKQASENIDFYNTVIKLQDAMRNNWTQSQLLFAFSIIDWYGYDHFVSKDLAQKLNYTPARLSNRIASTRIRQYAEGRAQLAKQVGREFLE